MSTFKAKVVHFTTDKEGWREIKKKAKQLGLSLSTHVKFNNKISNLTEVTLETKYLFSNQWNTEEGFRVFECALYFSDFDNKFSGYYLEIPKEAMEYRESKYKCGFCSELSDTGGEHLSCISSEYMREHLLHLAYFSKIHNPVYPEPSESAVQAFRKSRKGFAVKELEVLTANVEKKYRSVLRGIDLKRQLVEKGFYDLGNVIYYDHKDVLSFGWTTPLSQEEKLHIEAILKDCDLNWEFHSKG